MAQLHSGKGQSVWSHGVDFDWNPQVLLIRASVLLLFLFLFNLCLSQGGRISTTATITSSAKGWAAVTANNQRSAENKYRQHKEHNNTQRVVNALVVFGDQKCPQIIEEFRNLLLHGSTRALALRRSYAAQTRNILCSKRPDVYTTSSSFL